MPHYQDVQKCGCSIENCHPIATTNADPPAERWVLLCLIAIVFYPGAPLIMLLKIIIVQESETFPAILDLNEALEGSG